MVSEEFIGANCSEEMNDKFYDNYDELIDDRTIDNESIRDESIEDKLVDSQNSSEFCGIIDLSNVQETLNKSSEIWNKEQGSSKRPMVPGPGPGPILPSLIKKAPKLGCR